MAENNSDKHIRQTVEDLAEKEVRRAEEERGKGPELSFEEKNRIRLEKWKAMHGLSLDSRD